MEGICNHGSAMISHVDMTRKHLRIVVDLDLGEESDVLGGETKANVSTGITRATLDTSPVLDLGHNNIDTFAQEVVHVLSLQLGRDTQMLSLANAETSDRLSRLVGCDSDVGDGLDDHTGNVQV